MSHWQQRGLDDVVQPVSGQAMGLYHQKQRHDGLEHCLYTGFYSSCLSRELAVQCISSERCGAVLLAMQVLCS